MAASEAVPSRGETLTLLLDTNVILDYFIRRNERNAVTVELFGLADAHEEVVLYVASLSLKDASCLLERFLKREAASQGRGSEGVAAAAREAAWGCIKQLLSHVLVVSVGWDEVLEACALRRIHDEFEDDLILVAAMKVDADCIVTNDTRFERHIPQASLGVEQAVELVKRRIGAA